MKVKFKTVHDVPTSMQVAKKADTGKPKLSLLPIEGLEAAARAFEHGANKYGKFNHEAGHAYSRTLDAALRHLYAVANGEFTDADSGNSHVGHAIASLMMLARSMARYPELDDLTRKERK